VDNQQRLATDPLGFRSSTYYLCAYITSLCRLLCREIAAETIYKERCIAVNNGESWAKYMSISGSAEDEHDIITLQYTEEGLLTIDENRDGRAAAFGDDIAIECLATEFKREVYVVKSDRVNMIYCPIMTHHRTSHYYISALVLW
jgi:hypothetical protein